MYRGEGLENNVIVLGAKGYNPTFNFIHVGYNEDIYFSRGEVSRTANYIDGAVAGKPGIIIILSVHYNGDKSSLYCNNNKSTDFKAEYLGDATELNLGNIVSQGSNSSNFKGWIYDFIVQRGPMSEYRIKQIHEYLKYKWQYN